MGGNEVLFEEKMIRFLFKVAPNNLQRIFPKIN